MKKEISREEKLEFYKKYNSAEFIKELKKYEGKYTEIGFWGLLIMLLTTVVGVFFSLWFGFLMFPTVAFPFCMMAVSFKNYKKKVNDLTQNIKYKDFIKMCKNGEWQQIAKEVNDDDCLDAFKNIQTPRPSIIKEIKNHGCPYVDEDKILHKNDHDDLSV